MLLITGWVSPWAHSLYIGVLKTKQRGEGTEQQHTYKFAQGYNILHRLQVQLHVHHPALTFIIHYLSTLYLYTYILISIVLVNYINDNAFFFNDIINIIRYKLIGTYKEEWEKQKIIHDLYFFQLWVPMLLEHQVWMISTERLHHSPVLFFFLVLFPRPT